MLLAGSATSCVPYQIASRDYLIDLNYAQPRPGKFRVLQKDVKVSVEWDSEDPRFPKGSEAYMQRMSGLLTMAVRELAKKANLQDNQALYNVRVSAPAANDLYMAYVILSVAFWTESRAQVSITADVIEFT
jgi:hypothetical protein